MMTAGKWMTVGCGLAMAVLPVRAGDDAPQKKSGLHARVRVETSLGPFVIELDGERAPVAAKNVARYVEDGFYKGTLFHRVLADGLIQGGAFNSAMERKTDELRDGIRNESDNGLKNLRGTVAMYRAAGYVDSARAEFFINVGNNSGLDKRHRDGAAYTVFAKVVEGMDVVDRIASVKVGAHPLYGKGRAKVVPVEPVMIKSATLLSPFDYRAAKAMAESADSAAEQVVVSSAQAQQRMVSTRIAELEKQYGMPMTTTPSGLKYLVLRSGPGAPPIASETVTVHYIGTLADGAEFENTYTREGSQPVTKVVSKFIAGLQEGIVDMHEGEKRFFVVPSELGFRDVGIPQRIKPNATLFFELELLSIEPG